MDPDVIGAGAVIIMIAIMLIIVIIGGDYRVVVLMSKVSSIIIGRLSYLPVCVVPCLRQV